MAEIDRLTEALADRYAVERELGRGGMATVYLATDVKHQRRVALKVLHVELAAVVGAERFLNEIRVTANLQHPHILPLHDSGEADGFVYYVMPYVEGESLRDKLDRQKELSIDEAVAITKAVASALDYAHRRDVIHRDIKPENILLHDGQAVVADFGIALAVSSAGAARLTETGLSLGTPFYMSPEQAMGDRELDARSDVYSLACMTYEMLAGDPPYTGSTAQAVVAKVITEKPRPIRQLRDTVPASVEAAVLKALSKFPADRFATAQEYATAIQTGGLGTSRARAPADDTLAAAAGDARVAAGIGLLKRPAVPWVLVALLALGLAFATRNGGGQATGTSGPIRFAVTLGAEDRVDWLDLDLSPDGDAFVIGGRRGGDLQLYLHRMDRLGTDPIPGTRGGESPFFSPDGKWIAFVEGNRLRKVPVEGGSAIDIAEAPWGRGSWGPSDTIVYTPSYQSGLWRVPAGGGDPQQLTVPDTSEGELGHWWPQILPSGTHVLFTVFSTPIDRARIAVLSLESGRQVTLLEGGTFGRYAAGRLFYARSGTIWMVPFDIERLEVAGTPVPLLDDVATAPDQGRAGLAVADNGTLAYVPASTWETQRQLVWVSRSGAESPVLEALGRYSTPKLSPEGRRVALTINDVSDDVWVYEPGRDLLTRLTRHDAAAFGPLWTPDGTRVIYQSERPQYDLYWRTADGSAAEEVLFSSSNDKQSPAISPDGRMLAYAEYTPSPDIWLFPLDGSAKPNTYLETPFAETYPAFAPNGRWLAYQSNESGRDEVYIQTYPDPTLGRRQISTEGGTEPLWRADGRELFYRNGDEIVTVGMNPASGEPGRAQTLFRGTFGVAGDARSYDVSPDGQRFLMVKIPADAVPRTINIVLNWLDALNSVESGANK